MATGTVGVATLVLSLVALSVSCYTLGYMRGVSVWRDVADDWKRLYYKARGE